MDWVFTPSSSWDITEPDMDTDEFDLLETNQIMEDLCRFDNNLSEQNHSVMPSSPSGSSSEQNVSCLVDGCRADLSGCRDYHRRHRVCETHSKTLVVTIRGKEQRFCQQCSRFHSLRKFYEGRRSCRERLDGHNKRRQRQIPESINFNYRSVFTNNQGTKLLHFGGSSAYTTTFRGRSDKEKMNQKLQATFEKRTPSNSYARFSNARKRRFPFLLGVGSETVNQPFTKSSFQQVVNTNVSSVRLDVEPQGVIYLLSNSKHKVHHDSVPGPSDNLVQFNSSPSQHSGPDSGDTKNQLIGMIHFRPEELLENEAEQVLSFSWE